MAGTVEDQMRRNMLPIRETSDLTKEKLESIQENESAPMSALLPNARGDNNICEWCGDGIRVMAFKGTGSCSTNCHKMRLKILRDQNASS